MRIVIFDKHEGLKMSGMLKFGERLIAYLEAQGHEVYILRYSNHPSNNPHIITIPYYLAEPRTYIFIPSLKTYKLIYDNLQQIRPDIVYAYCALSPADFFLPQLCHSLNIPLAAVWHLDFSNSANVIQMGAKAIFWVYLPFCRQVDMLHVFSKKLEQFHIRHGVSVEKLCVIPNGVNSDFFSPGQSSFAKKYRIKTGILFLGRLTSAKNPESLLEAFLKINPPDSTKLVMVGDGEKYEKLKQKYTDPRIIFTGLIKNEKKKLDIIRSCQIFVQPSILEGMSLALLEAMSCGLACITSDAGENYALLKDSGTIIPILHLSTELSKVLSQYLSKPELIHQQGKQARKTIIMDYNQDEIFSTIAAALKKTIDSYTSRSIPSQS